MQPMHSASNMRTIANSIRRWNPFFTRWARL